MARSGTSGRDEMMELGLPHFTHKHSAVELDEGSILRRERVSAVQQAVNGFAGAGPLFCLETAHAHAGDAYCLFSWRAMTSPVSFTSMVT
jgi:hypothetical protein